jgi:membrane-associated phospholipid phosphatase
MGARSPIVSRLTTFDAAASAALTIPETRRVPRMAALLFAHTGDSPVLAVLLLGAWFLAGKQWRASVLLTVIGLLLAQIVTAGIKAAFKRSRPRGTEGKIYRRYDPYSFPSGHAARAAMVCILSVMFAPLPVLVAVLVWSPIMLLSRIAIGIHYVFDVVAGAVLGAALTYVTVFAVGNLVKLM